jgi:hypothetical protein
MWTTCFIYLVLHEFIIIVWRRVQNMKFLIIHYSLCFLWLLSVPCCQRWDIRRKVVSSACPTRLHFFSVTILWQFSYCPMNQVEPGWRSRFGRYSDDRRFGVQSPCRVRNFLFSTYSRPSRPALGPTQPPIRWAPDVKLTTHLQIMPRSRKRGYIHPRPHTSSWRSV